MHGAACEKIIIRSPVGASSDLTISQRSYGFTASLLPSAIVADIIRENVEYQHHLPFGGTLVNLTSKISRRKF